MGRRNSAGRLSVEQFAATTRDPRAEPKSVPPPADEAPHRPSSERVSVSAEMALAAECRELRERIANLEATMAKSAAKSAAKADAAQRVAGELRGVLTALETIELELAETRADARSCLDRLLECFDAAPTTDRERPLVLVRSEPPKAPATQAASTWEDERPTAVPERFDAAALMRAAKG